MKEPKIIEAIFIIIMMVCLWTNGYVFGKRYMKTTAIEKGYAEYHATTGEWQWKEKE